MTDFADRGNLEQFMISVKRSYETKFNLITKEYDIEDNLQRTYSHLLSGLMLEISTGLGYMHQRKIVHRDIAARNILIQTPSADSFKNRIFFHAKISDFGLARSYNIEQVNGLLLIRYNNCIITL